MACSGQPPVGLVGEGKSEYFALPILVRALGCRCTVPGVMSGQAVEQSAAATANRILPLVRAQLRRNVRKVLVVLDRESRETCSPDMAAEIKSEIDRCLENVGDKPSITIGVIVADRKLENWLLADPEGLATHSWISDRLRNHRPGRVDGTDGETELKRWMKSHRHYKKGEMTGDFAKCIRVAQSDVLARSRSLQKLSKEVTP